MYSNKPDYGQGRHYSSRDSWSWDEEPRREERRELPRNPTRDIYDKYSSDRLSSREYGESHKRLYSPDSKRDYKRKSPVKKHMSSPDRIVSEKRRRTFPEEGHCRYQREPEETYRQSPEQYAQRNKDFKRTVSLEEGYSRRRTPDDSRFQPEQDEFHYSKYEEEPSYKHSSEFFPNQERSRDKSQDRRRSLELTVKDYSPLRQRSGSFSRDYEDHNQNRTRFSLNGSSRQTGEPRYRCQSPPPPPPPASDGEKKMSKGFQRFLDVLNMGVNVDTLTRIVTQGTPEVNTRPQSPPSPNATERTWPGGFTQRQEESGIQNPNTQHWPETVRTKKKASPRGSLYSSNGNSMSEQRTVESICFERKFLGQDSKSISRSSLVKSTVRPEEEHKHRQMQDVLQAIGINLDYEELGQMSGRIQERLYGKKQSTITPNQREEMPRRHTAFYSRHRSRSSSRSSSSSSYQDKKSQSYQRDDWDFTQNDERGTQQQYKQTEMHRNERHDVIQTMSTMTSFQDNKKNSQFYQREERDFAQYDKRGTQQSSSIPLRYEKTEMHTKDSCAAIQVISPVTNIQPNLKPPPVIPPNPMLYSPLPPNVPNMFMPQVPPFLHYPQTPPIQPVNMFPPIVPPSGPILPPHLPFPPRPALPSLPTVYQPGPVNTNTQKSNKTTNRPRCLQVIPTKNPG